MAETLEMASFLRIYPVRWYFNTSPTDLEKENEKRLADIAETQKNRNAPTIAYFLRIFLTPYKY